MSKHILTGDYATFLSDLKTRILQSQGNAARAVNRELVSLYWDIGAAIVQKQQTANWGDSVVEQVAEDLQAEFPDMRGFSANNLWLVRRFYSEYSSDSFLEQVVQEMKGRAKNRLEQPVPEIQFLRQLVAEIPWGHNLAILHKVAAPCARPLSVLQSIPQGGTPDAASPSDRNHVILIRA